MNLGMKTITFVLLCLLHGTEGASRYKSLTLFSDDFVYDDVQCGFKYTSLPKWDVENGLNVDLWTSHCPNPSPSYIADFWEERCAVKRKQHTTKVACLNLIGSC
eukprot:Pgem_evm1s19990